MKRRPDFLLIGAMKAGSTSLYTDLSTHPEVYLPDEKETKILTEDRAPHEVELAYERLLAGARSGQLCGEASTAYSKLPDIAGVAGRARQAVGPEIKVVYLVREPVSRAVSHHYHEVLRGTIDASIDCAVLSAARLIAYSLYAMQIRPWIEALGEARIRIVRFESYVSDRRSVTASIMEFLGLEPMTEGIEVERIHNRAATVRVPRTPFLRLSRSPFYRHRIRPYLSGPARSLARRFTSAKSPDRPAPPSLETVDYILDRVRDDAAELQRLAGVERPLWDLEAVRRRAAEDADVSGRPAGDE